MENTDIAWLAGILEGEACFDFYQYKSSKKTTKYPRIRVEMRDRDIIERVKKIMGGGSVCIIKGKQENHSTTYIVRLCDRKKLKPVLEAILPFMSERRSTRILEMIEYCE